MVKPILGFQFVAALAEMLGLTEEQVKRVHEVRMIARPNEVVRFEVQMWADGEIVWPSLRRYRFVEMTEGEPVRPEAADLHIEA